MTTTNWMCAKVCYFVLFIGDFPAYVVDNWTCEDTYRRDKVVGERSCVVPAAFLLLIRSVCLPRFTLHLILHCRVTLRVCRREEIRREEESIV